MSKIDDSKIIRGAILLLMSILLTGCNADSNNSQENSKESVADEMQHNLSDLEVKKVVISTEGKEAILENDQAEQFVDILDIAEWEPDSSNQVLKEDVIITCELYEATNNTKERHVATINFYDNNAVVFKSGILQLDFTVSNDTINQVRQCME